MEQSPMLRQAARIAGRFRIDPLIPLRSNYYDWAARSAALNVVLADDRKREEAQQKQVEQQRSKMQR